MSNNRQELLNNGTAVGPQGEGMDSPSTFPKYPAYKDSGIEWVDTLPIHWEKVALKWVSKIFAGGTPDKTKTHYWENGSIPWLNSGAVNQVLIYEPSAFITTEAFNSSSARWIPAGSLVMALAGQGKTKGTVAQLAIRATCNQSMAAITPVGNVKSRYLFWWLSNNYQNIRNMAGGDLRDGLNLELIGDIPALMPSEEEQAQIARFLDHETARIDALIAEQQRLIELLKEKRQAVISHAVTKGLDPTVPMKDSGVEWLGQVPAHWAVCKLNFRYEVELGKMLDEKRNVGASPLPYLRNQDVQWGSVNVENLPLMDIHSSEFERYTVRPGDLLVCEGGDVGRAAIWSHSDLTVGYQKALHRLRVYSLQSDIAEFFFYVLMAAKSLGVFEESDTKATISHLPAEKFRQHRFAFPPLSEQMEIAEFLDVEYSRILNVSAEAEKTIALLQERRSALISAAVTGKIDVRNW